MNPNNFPNSSLFTARGLACVLVAAATISTLNAAPDAKPQPAQQQQSAPAPAVSVVTLTGKSVPIVKRLPGRIKPVRVAQVRARVPGILLKQVVREGADVKEGDVLFEIEPDVFEARVASAKANIGAAKANIVAAKAELNRASILAKRLRTLRGSKAVSEQEIDNAEASEKLAEAGVGQAEAALAVAEAALRTASIDLGYTKVKAPISGRIGRAFVTEGALVGQGDVTPLAEINQLAPDVYADFSIPANELTAFKQQAGGGDNWAEHLKLSLQFDTGKPYAGAGKLLLSEISVEPGTASVKVRSIFPNADWLLWPDMYVWGTFSHDDGKPAFLVPHQAVMRTAQGGASVFLVGADNKLVSVPVTTDETNGTNWVVRGNDKFYDGAKLVVEGGERALVPLKPGAVVTPVPFGEKDKPAGASAGASAK